MDTVYPEPIRLRLSTASRRHRGAGQDRYRTQPVTFSEIKEVDEENDTEDVDTAGRRMSAEAGQVMSSKSSSNVNAKYEELWSRRRADRKVHKKLQNRLDLTKTPSVSSIPGSPETENISTTIAASSSDIKI